jgi:hypothetical protein
MATLKKTRANAARIIAESLSIDLADMREYRYQPSRTGGLAIYAIGERYFAVSPAKPTWDGLDWREHPDQFWAKRAETVLWVADAGSA